MNSQAPISSPDSAAILSEIRTGGGLGRGQLRSPAPGGFPTAQEPGGSRSGSPSPPEGGGGRPRRRRLQDQRAGRPGDIPWGTEPAGRGTHTPNAVAASILTLWRQRRRRRRLLLLPPRKQTDRALPSPPSRSSMPPPPSPPLRRRAGGSGPGWATLLAAPLPSLPSAGAREPARAPAAS